MAKLTNMDKAVIRRALWDALGASDYSELEEHFNGEAPAEAWAYLQDREQAIGKLLGL